MNRVSLVGRLTKDPELRFTSGTGSAVTKVTIAVDEYDYKTKEKTAYFFTVEVWGKQAEALAQYMCKGGLISVVGKLRSRSYVAGDGTKRYVTDILADKSDGVKFLSKPSGNNQGGGYSQGNSYNQGGNYNQNGGYNQGGNYNQGNNHNQGAGHNKYNNQQQGNYSDYNSTTQSNNFGQSTEGSPFDDAFGGFGNDFMPVDDGDMPF